MEDSDDVLISTKRLPLVRYPPPILKPSGQIEETLYKSRKNPKYNNVIFEVQR